MIKSKIYPKKGDRVQLSVQILAVSRLELLIYVQQLNLNVLHTKSIILLLGQEVYIFNMPEQNLLRLATIPL